MLHAIRYVAVRHREYVASMGCDVSRIVGYRWVCSCGERGKISPTVAGARATTAEHVGATADHGTSSEAR